MGKINIADLILLIKIDEQAAIADGNVSHRSRLIADHLACLFHDLTFALE
jgi:hypothetical protein